MKKLIKKTKNGHEIIVENGVLKVAGRMATLMNIPENLQTKAKKALPGAAAMTGNILFTETEVERIEEAKRDFVGSFVQPAKNSGVHPDFVPANTSIPSDVDLSSATDGQLDIYSD